MELILDLGRSENGYDFDSGLFETLYHNSC